MDPNVPLILHQVAKEIPRPVVDAIFTFHFWGITPCVYGRVTSARMLRALMKLFHHMDEMHKPRSWVEVCDFTRDAGPRLLSCAVARGVLPVSRWYSDPPVLDVGTGVGFVRPGHASKLLPDVYVERMLLSSSVVQGDSTDAGQDGKGEENGNGDAQMQDVTMTDPTSSSTDVGSFIHLPPVQHHPVFEAVERAVMQFAYADLERDPTAAPRSPRPQLLATSEDDLYKSIVSSVPATSKVAISNTMINKVSRLLDAGSTVYDRKEPGWNIRLSRAEKTFIDATDANWDVLSRDESTTLRDTLWNVLAEESPAVRVGRFNSVWSVWAAATSNIRQFQLSCVETIIHCSCRRAYQAPSTSTSFQSSFVTPPVHPNDKDGVSIQEVISRPFAPGSLSPCRDCSLEDAVIRERRITSLPLRMIVTLDEHVTVNNHTQDFSFSYLDANGVPQTATYRWLGGVYMHNNHFRVCWTDEERGEAGEGAVKMYDGMQNAGLIVGGVGPYRADERVPPNWFCGRTIPLLVYERVIDPQPEVLNSAMHAVCGMMNASVAGVPVLNGHVPWAASGKAQVQGKVWNPILPTFGNKFQVIPTPYNPPVTIDDTTITSTADFQTLPQIQDQTHPPIPSIESSHTLSLSPPNPFTIDPQATLTTSTSPFKISTTLPVSIPITQRLNPSNSAFLPSADPELTGIAGPASMTPGPRWYAPGGVLWIPTPPEREGQQEMKMEMEGQEQEQDREEVSPEWDAWIRMSPDVQLGVVRVSSPGRGRRTGGKGGKDKDSKGKKVVQGRVEKKGKA
ncbi:uncharacterized protein ASPGLDRAFT_59085 [Aspergillus glaucus CBS 516.65]|uniref:Uncharacterized protein n=1 Tax=Aspergillus glaucus CBS 516.65 TaxID=1160497 RepID=A0A1L9VFG4_ASPGL|nr:hypothetical protein ASPGLDRAFT_59085 [Aspergillus glaucus CBS 516.65]OJJ82656.1 hypothetical protein ASPGLDRAFT_59085 [Aspergillus glaucus CBS 516.65]